MIDIENIPNNNKTITDVEDVIDDINKKISKTFKVIEKKCREQELELKKNNELILLELKDLLLKYEITTTKNITLL